MSNISSWLETNGLAKHVDLFVENEIDFDVLETITADDLEKLGVPLGARKRILKAISEFSKAPPSGVNESSKTLPPGGLKGEAERRQLTVMFCDLIDSTALSKRLDVEVFRDLILSFQNLCEQAVYKFDGYVARVFGDGLLIYFGYPQAHEDDVERAARAAIALLEALAARSTLEHTPTIEVRIGIATGSVVVGDIVGSGAAQESTVLGDTPNLAARLQSIATPNAIVVCDVTRRLLGSGFSMIDLGAQTLKGLDKPVPAWRLTGALEEINRFERTRGLPTTGMVGRNEELRVMEERWRQVQIGEGQVVYLSGEAGIGKSRLISAFQSELEAGAYMGITYQCSPFHSSTPLFPIAVQLRHAAGIDPTDSGETSRGKLERIIQGEESTISEVFPLFAELLGIAGVVDESRPTTPAERKEKLLSALIGQLDMLQRKQPLCVCLEDAHWVDPTTAEFIDRCIERLRHQRILLLISHRPEFSESWIGEAHVTNLSLRKLSSAMSSGLIESIAGHEFPSELVDDIARKTDGVPLFVEELTKSVIESGLVSVRDGAYVVSRTEEKFNIPSTLQASLTARLDRLAESKEVAQIGAVIGREFEHELLSQCIDRGRDELEQDLERLEATGLIFRRGSGLRRIYQFKHALVRDSAYDSLLKSRRAEIHHRVALCLESEVDHESKAGETRKDVADMLAYHFAAAKDWPRAVRYYLMAARQSLEVSSYGAALDLLHKALEITSDLSSEDGARAELSIRLEMGKIHQALRGFTNPEAEMNFRRAGTIATEKEDRQRLALAMFGLWEFHLFKLELDQAQDLAEGILTIADSENDDILRVVAYRTLANVAYQKGDLNDTIAHATAVLERYQSNKISEYILRLTYDPKLFALGMKSWVQSLAGELAQAEETLATLFAWADELDHPASTCVAHLSALKLHYNLGNVAAIGEHAAAMRELAQKFGLFWYDAFGSMFGYWHAAMTSADTIDTEAFAGEFEGIYRNTVAPDGNLLIHSQYSRMLAEALLSFGALEDAEKVVDEGLAICETSGERIYHGELTRLRGQLLLKQGYLDSGITELQRAISLTSQRGQKLFELRARASLCQALAAGSSLTDEAFGELHRLLASFSDQQGYVDVERARDLA